MDLPFAFSAEEEKTLILTTMLPSSSNSYTNVTTTTSAITVHEQRGALVSPLHTLGHGRFLTADSTTLLPSGTTMYDNIHQHFYRQPNSLQNKTQNHNPSSSNSTLKSFDLAIDPAVDLFSDFVTIRDSDVRAVQQENETDDGILLYDHTGYNTRHHRHGETVYASEQKIWNIPQMDVLSLLISQSTKSSTLEHDDSEDFVSIIEQATLNAKQASYHTKNNDISQAISSHYASSKLYKDAAISLRKRQELDFFSYSLLVMSNSQARSADMLLKNGGVMKGRGSLVKNGLSSSDDYKLRAGSGNQREERLRAKIRASMGTAESDMNESVFLGKAPMRPSKANSSVPSSVEPNTITTTSASLNLNAVDDLMELEKELQDLDATLDMGIKMYASVSSLSTKKTLDSSYMVVPGSSSYMSSSMMWNSNTKVTGRQNNHGSIPSNGKARANRVQTMLDASTSGFQRIPSVSTHNQPLNNNSLQTNYSPKNPNGDGLESSWWGGASVLAASTASLSNSVVGIRQSNGYSGQNGVSSQANTRQLMRLLDSLKTLGDENASLLREVEEAKMARLEAKAAREEVNKFKEEYNKRFGTLKAALQKSTQSSDQSNPGISVPLVIAESKFVKNQTTSEIERRDKIIQKLQAELNQLKIDSKKKDDALRKYENFYKEVKARSEQKKRQKESELNARK